MLLAPAGDSDVTFVGGDRSKHIGARAIRTHNRPASPGFWTSSVDFQTGQQLTR